MCGSGSDQTEPVYDPDNFQYVFFDFETVTKFHPDASDMKHCVQVAVAVSVCQDCKDAPVTETCDNCEEKEVIFYGRDSLQKFCEWLFDNRKGQWTAFAHNAQDEYFILNIYICAQFVKCDNKSSSIIINKNDANNILLF